MVLFFKGYKNHTGVERINLIVRDYDEALLMISIFA